MSDNIINVEFGEGILRIAARCPRASATKRGYSPDRAEEIAAIISNVSEQVSRSTFSIHLDVPLDASIDELKAKFEEVARNAGRQACDHCIAVFANAVVDLCYPSAAVAIDRARAQICCTCSVQRPIRLRSRALKFARERFQEQATERSISS